MLLTVADVCMTLSLFLLIPLKEDLWKKRESTGATESFLHPTPPNGGMKLDHEDRDEVESQDLGLPKSAKGRGKH